MTTLNNKNKIYETAIQKRSLKLTREEILSCGFTNSDIKDMIANGLFCQQNENNYELTDADGLLQYGKTLNKDNTIKAGICFDLCLQINPNNYGANLELLIKSIKEHNSDPYKYFRPIYEKGIMENNKIWNFYLFLLSFLVTLPREAIFISQRLRFSDCKNDLKDPIKNKNLNTIINRGFCQKWPHAIKFLNDYIAKFGNYRELDLMYIMLSQIDKKKKENASTIRNFIVREDYLGLNLFLNEMLSRHKASSEIFALFKISKMIIRLKTEKHVLIIKKSNPCFDALDAISRYDFFLARKLHTKKMKQINVKEDNLSLALNYLCELIKIRQPEIKEPDNETEEDFQTLLDELDGFKNDATIQNVFDAIESSVRVFDACNLYNTSDRERIIIILLIAKDKYENDDVKTGNKLMKSILKFNSEDPQIIRLYSFVRDNAERFSKMNFKNPYTIKPINE